MRIIYLKISFITLLLASCSQFGGHSKNERAVASVSKESQNDLCWELEKINLNEGDFGIPTERQRVFTTRDGKSIRLESNSLICRKNGDGQYSATVDKDDLCWELEKIDQNENDFGVPKDRQRVLKTRNSIRLESNVLICQKTGRGYDVIID